jgi:hypothetical protein
MEGVDVPESTTSVAETTSAERTALLASLSDNSHEAPGSEKQPDGQGQGSDGGARLTPEQEDRLRDIAGLHLEKWREGDVSDRKAALEQIDKRLAEFQGRPEVAIKYRDDLEDYEAGYYNPNTGEMHINLRDVLDDNPYEAVNTVAHEGRHAYQVHATRHDGFHHDVDEVERWRDNFRPGNYIRTEDGFSQEDYENQPVEADAFSYGDAVAHTVVSEQLRKENEK